MRDIRIGKRVLGRCVVLIGAALTAWSLPLTAQDTTKTTPDQLIQGAQMNPTQIRSQLQNSGMTTDQIHSKLQAAGMNPSVLDAYMGTSVGATGGLPATPGADVLAAIAILGRTDQMAMDAATSRDLLPTKPTGPTSEDGLPVFGLQIFRQPTNQFQPNVAGPVDASYRLGPLDVVAVILTGQVELAHTLEVTRDGFIVVPQVGQIFVANLTLDEATRVIVEKLKTAYTNVGTGDKNKTKVYVTVARLRSNQVFVVGDVSQPGSIQISAAGTALTALYAAGGPTIAGSLRSIEIRRNGKLVATVDLYRYLLHGDASQDVRLENGDIVFVPPHSKRVAVEGEVLRPAWYEMRAGETLNTLVVDAGGFTATAQRTRMLATRILPPEQRRAAGHDNTTFDVPASDAGGEVPSIPLVDRDRFQVLKIAERARNRVVVAGNVWSPGLLGWTSDLTVGGAIRKAGGLKPDTYYDEALVFRIVDDQRKQIISVPLDTRSGQPVKDVPLTDDDSIVVYSRTAFARERTVHVGGSVGHSADLVWREGLTLRDAVRMAGGLIDGALLTEAEISRLPQVRDGDQVSQVFRVPLDSGYLFDRAPGSTYVGPPGIPGPSKAAQDVLLLPYDQVNVLQQPDWNVGGSVSIQGEVRFPGEYAIKTRNERISDVVRRAGGLTSGAFAEGAVFKRKLDPNIVAQRRQSLDQVQRDRTYGSTIDRLRAAVSAEGSPLPGGGASAAGAAAVGAAAQGAIASEQQALQVALNGGTSELERIAIDFQKVAKAPGSKDDMVLRPGDQLFVPRYDPIVTVSGFVGSPVSLSYDPNATFWAYLQHAGGPTKNADVAHAFVVQPSGRVDAYRAHRFLPDGVPDVRPGAIIVVPPRAADISVSNTSWIAVLSIVASVATSIVAIKALSK